jgi:hypothetical protein
MYGINEYLYIASLEKGKLRVVLALQYSTFTVHSFPRYACDIQYYPMS